MLYSALCIDNTNYFENGTIRVRIFAYYNAPPIDDLSEDKELKDEGTLDGYDYLHEEFEAMIFTPFGGGKNYGMFKLPQMNEKGVVAFLDNDFGKPLWLGSYFSPIRDDDFKVTGVNIPNEDPAKEGEETNGIKDGEFDSGVDDDIKGDKDTFIFRTKTTMNDDVENLNWENVNTENLVVIDDKKIRIRHSSEWDNHEEKKFQEIMIYQEDGNDTIKLEVNDNSGSEEKKGVIRLTGDTIAIEFSEGGTVKSTILSDGDGISMSTEKDSTIVVSNSEDMIELNGSSDTIVLYSNLKDILEKLGEHIHIGSVPTTPPLDSSLAPLAPTFTQPIINMEGTKVKSEH